MRKYRYFGACIDTQQKWLNQMAKKGYRLVNVTKMSYLFEECEEDAYQYAVIFVAQLSYTKEKDYKHFLEDLGYQVFYKNLQVNYNLGKIKWRPYGQGMGQIATSPGNYNKELFIIEKQNDGKPFEIHTSNQDRASYYKPLRNVWLTTTLLIFGLNTYALINTGEINYNFLIFMFLGIICFIPTIRYQIWIHHYNELSEIEE